MLTVCCSLCHNLISPPPGMQDCRSKQLCLEQTIRVCTTTSHLMQASVQHLCSSFFKKIQLTLLGIPNILLEPKRLVLF